MADKPVTREEKYLAYLTGDYKGELPKPITRKEKYLYELCLKGIGGEISPEEIKNAVNEYLEKNPVKPGATTEQAQQIEQNKKDVASLKTDLSNKITKFYASNQGETHITDSDNGKIMDMMLYGKSSQDGTPTIDNPVEIESVVNPKVVVYGKNIAKKVTVVDEPQQYITSLYIVADLRPSATYVLSFECASGYSGYINEKLFEQITFRGTGNRQRVVCKTKSALQSSELSEKGWRIAKNVPGNTIVPKFTNVMLERISASIAYEPYHEQTITLPCTLNAIPVSSGGNVVIDGQQYIADYVDVERGELVRMVDSSKLDNTQSIVNKTEWLLAEPQEIDLTQEEAQTLKALATYYPTTNISINSEQLDGYTVFNYPTSFEDEWNKTQKEIGGLKEETGSLKEDLGDLLHHPKEYWTLGDITVPITGEWSNKQVKCEVDLSGMVGNTLKVSVGGISDNIDTHKCFINLLDEKENNVSDSHVLENTFSNHVITANGGYVRFDVSSIKNNVKYIKIQVQAYSGTKPTISGTIVYSDISAKDDSDKSAFIAEINEINLSDKLKDKLRISNNKGCVIKNIGDMSSDTTYTIASNNIKKNKTFIISAKVNSFTDKITIGHGINVYGGAFLEITPTTLNVYKYDTQSNLVKTVSHEITILNDIYIEITNFVSKYGFHATIKIASQGQTFTQSGKFDFPWTGSNGDVFIKTGTDTVLSDCKVSWSCSDLSSNIHAFGDSYFDYWNPKMADLGYSDSFLFDGFGGRKTLQAIEPLKFCLEHGTPKYVLWCLGMNNPDIDGVNSDWLNGFNTVILACKNKGIIPIFATIPNTPKNNNSYKNAYIKSSGYRYVDIAHYVGADTTNSNWYDGLLSLDKIHPTDKGAYIIAQNIITDLADIIFGN